MARKYSYLHSEIISGKDDIVGHITYSLYKSSKIEYIKGFVDKNKREPTEKQLEAFHNAAQKSIDAHRKHAEGILLDFTELTLSETIDEFKKSQDKTLREIIAPIIPKAKSQWSGFWFALIVKAVQSILLWLIFLIIIFSATAKHGIKKAVVDLLSETEVKDTTNAEIDKDKR